MAAPCPSRACASCSWPRRWSRSPRPAGSPTWRARCRGRSPRSGHDVRVLMPKYRGRRATSPTDLRVAVPRRAHPARRPRPRRASSSRAGRRGGVPDLLPRARPLLRPRAALRHRATATTGTTASGSCSSAAARLEARRRASGDGAAARLAPAGHPRQRLADRASCPSTSARSTATIPTLGAVRTLFTIHNLAYQGVFWHYDMPMTGLGWDLFTPAGLEFYGKLNFLKGGLVFADVLTTVSRTYAREIRTAAFGSGLEGVLEERSARPARRRQRHRPRHVEPGEGPGHRRAVLAPTTRTARRPAATRCARELGLARGPGPVIGIVTRLAEQKGLDLVLDALPALLAEGASLVVLGSGDAHLEEALRAAAARASRPGRRPDRVRRTTSPAGSTRAPTASSCPRATSRAASASSSPCATAPCRSCAARAGSPTPCTEFDPAPAHGHRLHLRCVRGGSPRRRGAARRRRLSAARALESARQERDGRGLLLGGLRAGIRHAVPARRSRPRSAQRNRRLAMKKIEAMIKPFKLDDVKDALHELGVSG